MLSTIREAEIYEGQASWRRNKSLAKEVWLKCIPRTCDKLRPPQSTRAPLPADYDVIAQAPPTTAGGLHSINGVSLALKKDVLIFNAILIELLNAMW